MTHRLSTFDLALIAVYLIGITLFGLRFREKKSAAGLAAPKSLKSYFLANNTIPWWAIALSIVSAETSTLTIISVPGIAFTGDFGFLQIVLGYMLGRIVVAALFLPRYFQGSMLTAYQLIDQRFGPFLHKVTAGLFLLTRAAAEGVRVFAVSIVVGIAIGTGDILSIAIISALTLLYTFEGGMAAVIWTDVVQMVIYIAGTFVAIWSLGHHIAADSSAIAGWHTILAVSAGAGKLRIFNFALNLTQSYTFWAGILGGTFLTMASHGTDQLMVQRMLAARNLRESRLALLSSGVVIFIQFALFLLIGAGLFVFAQQVGPAENLLVDASSTLHIKGPIILNIPNPGAWIHGLAPDRIFPTFIVHELPTGIAGLLVAAILAAAMSNLSAALNSLSSTTVVDFYLHLRPTAAADTPAAARERNLISKSSTVLWAIILFAIAVYSVKAGGKGHVVEIALSIASVAYGCLLGVFLLGTLTRYATQWGTAIGMLCGFIVNIALWQFPGKVLVQLSVLHTQDGPKPGPMPDITIPHIAFTWYVLIGAFVTFAIGSLASLIFRNQSRRTTTTATTSLLLLFLLSFPKGTCFTAAAQSPATPATIPNFTPITTLLNDAIQNHHLPGAVVLIGHNNRIAFEQAYGNRKLAGEPGLDGKPSPAEPMTEDTIFDMASLTKDLATATAVMQLYDQQKIAFDDPIEKYLPAFNPTHDPNRTKVTIRLLLTHFSGEPPDISLKDPWGLATPDRNEGFNRALAAPLANPPAAKFVYSDINFILLGALVEKLSGQREDDYTSEHIFKVLGMKDTRYLPLDKSCGPDRSIVGAAMTLDKKRPKGAAADFSCALGIWYPGILLPNIAPTTHDDEGNAATNPHFDMLTRGTVHDPTTRRMGGVAGHAGVFSTAHDISLYAAALLEKLLHNTGPFPVSQATLRLMTTPEQPGHNTTQISAAQAANDAAIKAGDTPSAPGLAPHYPAIKDQNLRGFGWDIDTGFSKPRGSIFPILGSAGFASFGHTGFTGTSLWMDPTSNTYVILLANAIHPRGNPPISNLRGQVATAAAKALGLPQNPADVTSELHPCSRGCPWNDFGPSHEYKSEATLTGIDVLESTHFAALANLHHLALFTNQSGIDAHGTRTIDVLTTNHQPLITLFSPEHGLTTSLDTEHIANSTDPGTHLPIISLYGAHDADRHPTHAQLANLDAVIIDLQDAGVRFWTYEAATSYFLEAAATEQTQYHHDLQIILLDRPNLIGGIATQGPLSDPGSESYVNTMPLPVRHGLTLGELARYYVATHHLATHLMVIPMQRWSRTQYFADTGLPWVNPSPNLRSPEAAILYPALGLIETTNISVGRGTDHPFNFFGAPWLNSSSSTTATSGPQPPDRGLMELVATLTARHIPGVTFTAATETIAEDANHYPFHGQTIPAVRITLADPRQVDTPELGIEILAVLHRLYPTQFQLAKVQRLLCNQATLDALTRGDDPHTIAASWQPAIDAYKQTIQPLLLYP